MDLPRALVLLERFHCMRGVAGFGHPLASRTMALLCQRPFACPFFSGKEGIDFMGDCISIEIFVQSTHIAKFFNVLPILMNHGTDRIMSMHVQRAR